MKTNHYIFFLLLVACCSCKKYKHENDDLKGLLYIHGRIYLADTLGTTGPYSPAPYGLTNVKIGYARENAINYIYSVQADSNGYFTFQNLSADSAYVIFSKTQKNGVYFYQQRPYNLKASLDTTILTLYPTNQWQNGMVFTVNDSGNPPEPLNGCEICLFKSQLLFQADTCAGANYILTTNPFGAAYQVNVPSGIYYAIFKDSITPKSILRGQGMITVPVTGLVRESIQIK